MKTYKDELKTPQKKLDKLAEKGIDFLIIMILISLLVIFVLVIKYF